MFSGQLLVLSHCLSALLFDLEASSGLSQLSENLLRCDSCALGNLSVPSHRFSVLSYDLEASSGFSSES